VGKDIDRRPLLIVEPGVISDQANVFPAQGREFFRFQDVEAGLHAAGVAPALPGFSASLGCDRRT
jgi:hypothetical protein